MKICNAVCVLYYWHYSKSMFVTRSMAFLSLKLFAHIFVVDALSSWLVVVFLFFFFHPISFLPLCADNPHLCFHYQQHRRKQYVECMFYILMAVAFHFHSLLFFFPLSMVGYLLVLLFFFFARIELYRRSKAFCLITLVCLNSFRVQLKITSKFWHILASSGNNFYFACWKQTSNPVWNIHIHTQC